MDVWRGGSVCAICPQPGVCPGLAGGGLGGASSGGDSAHHWRAQPRAAGGVAVRTGAGDDGGVVRADQCTDAQAGGGDGSE